MTVQLRRSDPTTLEQLVQTRVLVDASGAPISLRAAAASNTGTFEGYACLWNVRDSYGTTFAPGCFGAGGLDADLYALLAMHDPTEVIGTFTAKEDDTGLWITGGWDDTSDGEKARARARSGSAPELSVGFVPLMLDPDDENLFTQTRLVEVSQITRRMGAVPGAAFANVRTQIPRGRPGEEGNDNPGEGRLGDGDDTEQLERAAAARALLELQPVRPLDR